MCAPSFSCDFARLTSPSQFSASSRSRIFFEPDAYEDSYRDAVLELVEAKAAGKNIELPEPEEAEAADDLLAQLEASLAG